MNKKVIVIGASSGIGRYLAEHYAREGCKVGIAARREEKLREIAALYPGNISYMSFDVVSGNSQDYFISLVDSVGGADLVIYCS
ncbi:MAG: SDR family NAD(P)-dependent oxidoreductase, partial [Bacteroidales bacterium]|nr:SDR family NAD(P)-dependent oxidoreductase [Bacteroidales bacterium]